MRLPVRLLILPLLLHPLAISAAAQDFQGGTYIPFDEMVVVEALGAQIVLNGNIAVAAPTPSFLATVDPNGVPDSFTSDIELRAAVTAEISADVSGDFEETISGPLLPLPPFQVGANIIVVPHAYANVTFRGTAEAGMRIAMVQEISTLVSISIASTSSAGTDGPPKFHADFTPPEVTGASGFDVEMEVHAGVLFLVTVQGIPIGGPIVEASFGLEFGVNPVLNPWWELDGLVAVTIGWAAPDFDLALDVPVADVTLYRKKSNVAQARSGFPVLAVPSFRWSRVFDLAADEGATALVPLKSGYVVLGNGAGIFNRAWIAGLALDGSASWEKLGTSAVTGTMRPTDACATTDGGLAACGWVTTASGARIDRYADTQGTPLWSRTLVEPTGGLISLNAIAPAPNGAVIVAGRVSRATLLWTRAYLAEIDAAGLVTWAKELDLGPDVKHVRFEDLTRTEAGRIVAVGNVEYANATVGATIANQNALVVAIDANGVPEFAKAIGGVGTDDAFSVAVVPDGTILLGGLVALEDHAAWLACLESDGALRWSATYAGETVSGSSGDTGFDRIEGVAPLSHGGFLVTGTTGNSADKDAWLFRVDDGGMPVWLKSLRGADEDVLLGIEPVKWGLIAWGRTKSINTVSPVKQTDLWVGRTAVDGMLRFDPSNGFDARNDEAQWKRTDDVVIESLVPVLVDMPPTTTTPSFLHSVSVAVMTLLTL